MTTPREKILLLCTELGEDIDSPNCKTVQKLMNECPSCEAFVDSVKKTIRFYQSYTAEFSDAVQQRLYKKLHLE